MLLRLVGPVKAVEIGRHLDSGVAVQGRTRRNAIVDLDRKLRLLERFIEIGERQKGKWMIGAEEERELQIDQAQVLSASPAKRGAEAIKCLSGTRLNVGNEWRQFLACLEFVHRLDHERMAWQRFVEGLENRHGLFGRAVARNPTAVSLHDAQGRGV